MKFNVALLQLSPQGTDQSKNLEKGIEYCKKAKELGADLVLFPEEWNIGFQMCPADEVGRKEWENSAIDQDSDFFQGFVKIAKELELNIAITYLEKFDPKPRNSISIINNKGEIVLNYSKVFICNFGMEELKKENPDYDEVGCDYNCTAGDSFDVCTLSGKEGDVKIGAMTCADREFPEAATQLFLNGAELIIVPNACTWNDSRDILLKARALENFVGIAMTNYPSPQNNGNSTAYDCVWSDSDKDNLIVKAGEEEGIFMATFDMDSIRDFREKEAWRLEHRINFHNKK